MAIGGRTGNPEGRGGISDRDIGRAAADRATRGSRPSGRRSEGGFGPSSSSQRNGVIRAKRLRQTSDPNALLSDKDTVAPTPVDPAPQSADQVSARQAEVRRLGRGQTILTGRLGVAAGPRISRPTLG